MDIMTALFDEEEVERRFGIRKQREKAEDIARNMLHDGVSPEKISVYTGLAVSEIERLSDFALA